MNNSIFTGGNPEAKILVVLDPPSKACVQIKKPITQEHLQHFAKSAVKNGFQFSDFAFVSASPYIPEDIFASKLKSNKFMKDFRLDFLQTCAKFKPEIIVTMGSMSANQVAGRATKITEVRGQGFRYKDFQAPVFHMFNCGYALRSPSVQDIFDSDFRRLAQLRDFNWSIEDRDIDKIFDLKWCTDLTDWIKDPPNALAFDTEGTGLDWYKPEVYPFTLQLCRDDKSAIIIPILESYYPELERDHKKLLSQCKQILENPKIRKAAHNFNYDYHMLSKYNIKVANWAMDTTHGIHAVNENLTKKSLSECIRLFVPEMSGYSDKFDQEIDKSDMINVDKDRLRVYGCGDALGVFKLAKYIKKELAKDKKQLFLFENVRMPAIRTFADTLETNGVYLDECKLQELVDRLTQIEKDKYDELIKYTPPAVKRKHLELKKELSFTRPDFTRDVLFSKDGFNLTPKVFTKSTQKSSVKVASTSSKDHLPHFKNYVPKNENGSPVTYKVQTEDGEETKEYKYVEHLMEYSKLNKVRTTYVGFRFDKEKKGPSGFWQYIYNGKIHPSYSLLTLTNRAKSQNPNGQNLPARGTYAEMFQELFPAPPGHKLIKADYGQAEIRVVAWHANDPTMIQAYKEGKDLHAITAATMTGMSYENFMDQDPKLIKKHRYGAKACIAEGSLVLTNQGLISIENLTEKMLVWDGVEFVNHKGLIYKGIKQVITYQGLTATPDHKVLLENGEWVRFDYAKKNRKRIATGAFGEIPVRFMGSSEQNTNKEKRILASILSMPRIRNREISFYRQLVKRKNKKQRDEKKLGVKQPSIEKSGRALRCYKTTLRESKVLLLEKLRCTWDKKQIHQTTIHKMGYGKFTSCGLQESGYRPYRQRWTLRTRKLEAFQQNTEFIQSTENKIHDLQRETNSNIAYMAPAKTRLPKFTVRKRYNKEIYSRRVSTRGITKYSLQNTTRWAPVYDIRGCGSRNRFTVSGVIVHNCNFGNLYRISAKGFQEYAYTTYGLEISLEEAEEAQDKFFNKYRRLRPWHEEMIEFAHEHGYVRTLHGAKRTLPDLKSSDKSKIGESERQAINSPIQGFASDLGVTSLIRIYRDLLTLEGDAPPLYPCMFIHDANVFLVRDEYLEEAMSTIKFFMENPPFEKWYGIKSPVPFEVDIEYGQNLRDMVKAEHVEAIAPCWWQSDEPFFRA